jgi:hypothetical protein
MMRSAMFSVTLTAAAAMVTGCSVQSTSGSTDASRYLDPIPQVSDVAIGVPAGASTPTSQAKIRTEAAPASSPAEYYALTRDITDGVDLATASVLGTVWLLVNLPATSVAGQTATWGPMHDPLSPVTWRFTVSEGGYEVYSYELDARPASSTSDADYQPVLTGEGYGRDLPQHRTGWFQWNADVINALDPLRASGSGTTKITFDLTTVPTTIQVDQQATVQTTIAVTHEAGGAGQVVIATESDLKNDGALENVAMNSRWGTSGAGRADAEISGGDLGAVSVSLSQCWDTTFSQTYYTDSAGFAPTSGEPSTCIFGAATP